MRILGINSSPRRQDSIASEESSTRLLLAHALQHLEGRAETEIIDLATYDIKPTEGCYSTNENLCQVGFDHYADDCNAVLFEKILKADGVIFSSPVYWLGMSSRLAALFERLTELDPIVRDPAQRPLHGKVAGAIATAHLDGAADVCYDILKKANYLGFIVPPHAFAIHTVGQHRFTIENKETLKGDFVAWKNAEMVAENVLKMCTLVADRTSSYWTTYFEPVRPLSDDERDHRHNPKEERERNRHEGFSDQNRNGII